ncbi:MAG: glycosyltransferase family 39 protein [Candidatus Anstonellales archaeon]
MKGNVHYFIFFLAFVLSLGLRLYTLYTTEPWWDENLYTVRPYNFFNSDHISTIDQSPLYFYMADLVYKIFGLSILSSRFLSLVYGLLSIPLLYLLIKEFSSPTQAILSSLFLSFSGFHISYTIGDMGLTCSFFILLFLYFSVKLIKTTEPKYLFLSSLTLGIATLIKSYALAFGFVSAAFLVWRIYKSKVQNQTFALEPKNMILSAILLILLISPLLIYNFLLFNEKGQMDIIFTRFFRLDPGIYEGLGMPEFDIGVLPEHFSRVVIEHLFKYDPAILLAGTIGLGVLLIRRPTHFHMLLASCFVFPFIFLLASTGLPKNFTVFAPLLSFFASEAVLASERAISRFIKSPLVLPSISLLIVIFSVYVIVLNYERSHPTLELREEIEKHSPQNTLYIADTRIYRGKIAWALMDRHYLETAELNYFPQLRDPNNYVLAKMVLIECVPGDCGWGESKADKTLYEKEINSLKSNLALVREIKKEETPYYRIYVGTARLEPYSLLAIDYLHVFYFYPVGWKDKRLAWDNYNTDNPLHQLGRLVLYLSLLSAVSLSGLFIWLFLREANPKNLSPLNKL